MRTFGTEIDLVIDNELRKGMNRYNMILYQNGNKLDIYIKKMTIHFLTAAVPYGNVTKYYFELETDYMDFLEQDEVKVEIEKNGVSVEVSTFYIKSFKKGEAISTYVAYTSLVEPEKIRLYKIDEERPWRVDWNTGAKTIREILDTFLTPIGMSMSEYPTYTGTFVSYYADWENMSLAQLISACGILEGCNYVLIGNVFHPIRPSTSSSFKSYKISETVYKDNFYQQRSDAKCGIMDIGYKRWAYEDSTSEDPMLGFQVSFTSMLCHWERTSRGTGKFRTDFPLIPAEHSKKLFDHFADKLSCYFGFDMNVYSVSYLGDALLEPGDRVCFYSNDKSAFFYPSELIWEWDGGLKCTAKSEAVQKSGTSDATVSLQELANTLYTLSTTLQNVRYNSVTTKTLEADSATIGLLKVEQADVKYATIQSLTATEAKITTLDSATIKTDELYAKVAELDYIKSDHADIAVIKNTMITTDTLKTEIAKIGYLTTDEADIRYLTVSTANATFLHADMSDMDIAKIQTLFATAGIVSDMTIKDGHITGVLDSVTVNANSITTGTLSVDRLVIRGSEKSLVYELNNISGALQAKSVDTLNGEILTQRTITADKLVAKSITSNEIKTGTITSDEIKTGTITAANINMIDLVGDSAFINSLKTNTVIVGLQNDINGISVGGRNLLYASIDSGQATSNTNVPKGSIIVGTQNIDTYFYLTTHVTLIVGETYTISCDATNVPDGCNWSFGVTEQGAEWQLFIDKNGRCFATGTPHKTIPANTRFILDDLSNRPSPPPNITLSNFKLEKGNRATDWTPAPEDVDSLISAAQSTANSANSLAGTANTTANTAFANTNRGLNKWLIQQYSVVGTTIDGIIGHKASPVCTYEYADSALNITCMGQDLVDYYTGYAKTYLYFSEASSVAMGVTTDDNGAVYLNGVKLVDTSSCVSTNITLPFKKGWNVVEVTWQEGAGGDGFYFSTALSTLAACQRMDCYANPAILDYYTIANGAGSWCYNNDITYINGGKIYTGTVTADKIAANAITADKIATDAIKSRNYVKDTAGTFINMADGSWDSKYTKIDAEGKISCSDMTITGGNISLVGTDYTTGQLHVSYDTCATSISPDGISVKRENKGSINGVWSSGFASGTAIISAKTDTQYNTIDFSAPFGTFPYIRLTERKKIGGEIINQTEITSSKIIAKEIMTSTGASLNTVNSNLAQLSDDKVLKSNRGWYPNGKSLYAVPPGVYSTNPGAMPSGLGGLNTYGTLLVLRENNYQTAIYMSVVGQMAFWAANSNAWSIIKS